MLNLGMAGTSKGCVYWTCLGTGDRLELTQADFVLVDRLDSIVLKEEVCLRPEDRVGVEEGIVQHNHHIDDCLRLDYVTYSF